MNRSTFQANKSKARRKRQRARASKGPRPSTSAPNRRQVLVAQRRQVVPAAPRLSPCAEYFLKAAVDPFNYNYQTLPCVPDSFNNLTQRARIRAFGSGSTCSTSGFGYVACSVAAFVASDNTAGTYTDGNGSVVQIGSATTGILNWQSDAPYQSADIGLGLKQYRVVGAGLRVMYMGSNLDMQGQIQAIVSPVIDGSSSATVDGYSISNSSVIQSTVPLSFANRRWHEVVLPMRSANQTAMDYTQSGKQVIALMMYGKPNTPLSFMWEFVAYVEYGGQGVSGAVPSESDPVGFAAATTAISKTYGSRSKTYSWNQVKKEAVNYLKEIGPKVVSYGLKTGAKALLSAL